MVPQIQSSFATNGLFANKHFSTIYPALFRKIRLIYKRKRMETPDGDFFDADLLTGSGQNHLLLMHGLEGSSASGYIMGMADSFNRQGFHVHALNFRSCSGEMNRKAISYHSGFTADVRWYILQLLINEPKARIYLCGFSLGGNALLKYLAEEGAGIAPQIIAACAFSVPVDLASSAEVLASRENKVYMQRFLYSLKSKIKQKAALFPKQIDASYLSGVNNFRDFDNHYTAPLHGYVDAADYWEQCSSKFVLHRITIPVLLLNAVNDPFLHPSCFPQAHELNQANIFLEYPANGGHVGFKTGWNGTYWIEQRAADFFKTISAYDE